MNEHEALPVDKKPINWMRIAVMVLVPLFTVWYVDREKRIDDLKTALKSSNEEKIQERLAHIKSDNKKDSSYNALSTKYVNFVEKTYRYNDSVTKDNRQFINEIKGLR